MNNFDQKLANWDLLIAVLSVIDIFIAFIIESYIKIPYILTYFRFNQVICCILLIEAVINIKKYRENR